MPTRIVIDTREQRPYLFENPLYRRPEVALEVYRYGLSTGDYSLATFEHEVACERKSLPDLVQCLGRERKRFWAELERGAEMKSFAVFVEGDWRQLAKHEYRSLLKPQAALGSVLAIGQELRIPVFFCGSRAASEWAVFSYLRLFLKHWKTEMRAERRRLLGQAG